MRLGIVARADNRGLGVQTWEAVRHLDPAKVLVVDMGGLSPYEMHLERFPDATVLPFVDGVEDVLCEFLEGLDVVWSAETPYWYELLTLAKARDVRTVICGNFEFLRWVTEDLCRPDLFQAPSTWHADRWPDNTVQLPFPVARDRLPFTLREGTPTFIHVQGHPAMQDRAGTRLLYGALRYVRHPMTVVIRSQRGAGSARRWQVRSGVDVRIEHGDVENYWDIYAGADVAIQPRRYGGQSLPLNEASSLGMPVVVLDRDPERDLLPADALIAARPVRRLKVQSGEIQWWDASPRTLAAKLDELIEDEALVERLSKEADAYAESISWERLLPSYVGMFESLL